MVEPNQWTFLELRGEAPLPEAPWTTRWYPPVEQGEDVFTVMGHCLVITDVDWVGDTEHRAIFMLQHWDGYNESTQSPLLYGVDGPAGGSWRSHQGVMVPQGRVLWARVAVGTNVLIRGYWLPEYLLANVEVAPQDPWLQPEPRMSHPPDLQL